MLKIDNFSKIYAGKFTAVDNLNLEIKDGHIFGFIGHNGAGKTTTLKSIAGILNISKGDILINGLSIQKDVYQCKKDMAYIPDNPDLYESLTGIQYLNFVADMYEMTKEDRKKNIEHFAKDFEIYEQLGDVIGSYSHGMKQKLVLISAFMHNPKLIIMDEPFVGLDPKASFTLKKNMREFCDNGGIIIFSTHVLEVAEKLCDDIAIIKKGKLVLSGETAELVKTGSLEDIFMKTVNGGDEND